MSNGLLIVVAVALESFARGAQGVAEVHDEFLVVRVRR